eukprot:scaffold6480_cov215-Prasinococcus_capsulatus_cf.AAC.2
MAAAYESPSRHRQPLRRSLLLYVLHNSVPLYVDAAAHGAFPALPPESLPGLSGFRDESEQLAASQNRYTLGIKVRGDQAVFSLSGGTESGVALDAFGPRLRRNEECVQSILVPGTRARSFNVCPRCSR